MLDIPDATTYTTARTATSYVVLLNRWGLCSVATKVDFCPLAGAKPLADQNSKTLAGGEPLVSRPDLWLPSRTFGGKWDVLTSPGQIWRQANGFWDTINWNVSWIFHFSPSTSRNYWLRKRMWAKEHQIRPNVWNSAKPLALTKGLVRAVCWNFWAAGGLAGC